MVPTDAPIPRSFRRGAGGAGFVTLARDRAFLGIHLADGGVVGGCQAGTEIARNAVGQRQGVEANEQFSLAFHGARGLCWW